VDDELRAYLEAMDQRTERRFVETHRAIAAVAAVAEGARAETSVLRQDAMRAITALKDSAANHDRRIDALEQQASR
jgi:hypothetical protein